MTIETRGRPRTTPVIAILVVLIALASAALVIQAASPACAAPARASAHDAAAHRIATAEATGSWAAGAPMPDARGETGAAVVDGLIVVPGGLAIPDPSDPCGASIDSTVAYDPAADAWTERAPMPGIRDHAAVTGWDGLAFVSGGGEFSRGVAHANLWAYDPVGDAWTELAPMPAGRWQHAMVALDGVLYVVGGLIDDTDDHTAVWAYDVATDAWRTDLAPLPTAREHLAAVVADGRIVVLGGRMGENYPTVELYDPATGAWSSGPDMATPRGGFTAGTLSDGIHVTGGEDFDTRETIGSHEILDMTTMTWSAAPDLPTSRHGVASAVVDDRWYVIGGGREVGLSTSDVVEIWAP
jgi:N-acetylneuraminic acid mutarotase